MHYTSKAGGIFLLSISIILFVSCSKFTEVEPPRTALVAETVFSKDATATAAVLGIYNEMTFSGFASGDITSVTFLCGLSSDELTGYRPELDFQQFNTNALLPSNAYNEQLWNQLYSCIFKANAIIEGLASANTVSPEVKKQLDGEARFIRAFCHFYLVNLFGDIPLVTSTDYKTNANVPRALKQDVYDQIIIDLKDAKDLLTDDYVTATNKISSDRVRVNRGAATAFLARVYLFTGDWINAEREASNVINKTSTYEIVPDVSSVFLKDSKEAIWQLMPVSTYQNTAEATIFIFSELPVNAELSSHLINSFEPGDLRRITWTNSIMVGLANYYMAYKYKIVGASDPLQEYSIVLRLAEQYLIRAEARARQGVISGPNSAASDINVIRNRAGLGNTTATTQPGMLAAIEQERKVELFTEWGHRWFDLKRTDRIDAVLGVVKQNWASTDALYPIPSLQLLRDPNMTNAQNPGY